MKKFTFFKIASVITLLTIIVIACKKGDDKNAAMITDAIVYDSGSIAADGCGWVLKIPVTDSTYSPVNLADQYKTNNLKVHVRFHPLTTRNKCGLGTGLQEVMIDNITKTN